MADTNHSQKPSAPPGSSARVIVRELARAERAPLITKSLGLGFLGGTLARRLGGALLGLGVGLLLARASGWVLRHRGRPSYWRRGATGERWTGWRLNALRWRGWTVLHDLSVPGTRANLDHLVVGPFGVAVVDSKNRSGHVRFSSSTGHLKIGNTGAPLLVKAVRWESGKVAGVLSSELGRPVPVLPVLAVHVPRSRLPH